MPEILSPPTLTSFGHLIEVFRLTKGFIVLNKMNGTMQVKGKSLETDKTWNATIDVSFKQKGKVK